VHNSTSHAILPARLRFRRGRPSWGGWPARRRRALPGIGHGVCARKQGACLTLVPDTHTWPCVCGEHGLTEPC
jgi:hypothetical protein